MNRNIKFSYQNLTSKVKSDLAIIKNCFILLNKREIKHLGLVSAAQLLLALFDFIGVLAIGLIGMLSVYGIQSRTPTGQLKYVLDLMGIDDLNFQTQTAIVGFVAGVILISKSLLSAWINQKTISFLASRSAEISVRLIGKLAFSSFEQIKRRSRFENIYALTNGVQSITIGVIGTVVNLFADLVLITIMFFGLLIVDTSIALFTVIFFGSVALALYFLVNRKVSEYASEGAKVEIANNQFLYELFGLYREIFAGGIRDKYITKIAELRRKGSKISANSTFVRDISKYVLEIAFVVGAISFIGTQFVLKDAVGAISSISLFVASAGRIIPAVLRVQTAALVFRGALSGASLTLRMIQELKNFVPYKQVKELRENSSSDFLPEISLNNLHFTYSGALIEAIREINLKIGKGEWVAIVGPSGAGKTTLVDLLLGILKPTKGEVLLSGIEAESAIANWPGSVSYVPQDSFMIQASLEENIALGMSENEIDSEQIVKNLEQVGLLDMARSNPMGTKLQVGELGNKLSGGQKQRVGIARALYTNPKLIILDEATSALDTISEANIIQCLQSLKGQATVVSIAHRLSTVLNADRVIYIESGKIIAEGSFDSVREKVPNFDTQAKLANIGLQQ
jgi:ATP-binding cassette subfamily C protein